jgi:integrase
MSIGLTNAAADFAALVAAEKTQKERVNLCIMKRKELEANHTIAAARRYLTVYRAALKDNTGIRLKAALLNSLKISAAKNKKIIKAYENKVSKSTELAEWIDITAADAAEAINHAKALLLSGKKYKVAAALMLLTGRRTAEVYISAKFTPTKGTVVFANFEGQIKQRGETEKPYKVPLLDTFTAINKGIIWLQSQYEFANIAAVNTRISKDLGTTIKSEFSKFLGADICPHDLRKFYASVAYASRPPAAAKASFRTYAQKILGHSGQTAGLTSEAYRKYRII